MFEILNKMSKVIGPFFSLSASKLFGKVLDYRTDKHKTIVSLRHEPGSRSPFTLGVYQVNAKIYTAEAVSQWQQLSGSQKKEWNDFVK